MPKGFLEMGGRQGSSCLRKGSQVTCHPTDPGQGLQSLLSSVGEDKSAWLRALGICEASGQSGQDSTSFFFFFFPTATPVAYGSSQARSQIRAAAEADTSATATLDLGCICDLHCILQQRQILNPLSEARDLHLHGYCVKFLTL